MAPTNATAAAGDCGGRQALAIWNEPAETNCRSDVKQVLHYGRSRQPLVEVIADDFWPGMFRLRWPCGAVSDMTNLSRTVDAAVTICERGPPARNRRLFGWQTEPSKTPSWAPPIRQNGGGL